MAFHDPLEDAKDASELALDKVMATILRIGLYLSTSILLVGACIYFYHESGVKLDYHVFAGVPLEYTTLSGVMKSSLHFNSEGIMQLGLFVLILVPVARVLLSIYAFAKRNDYLYSVISLIVFAILLYSLVSSGI